MTAMTPAAKDFFQLGVEPPDREDRGLHAMLHQAFPVRDHARRAELVYVSYEVRPPEDGAAQAIEKGITLAAGLALVLQLGLYQEGAEHPTLRAVREQRVGTWDVAVPTPEGIFVIDGVELALDAGALPRLAGDVVAGLARRAAARIEALGGEEDLTPADLLLDEEG
jgi:DNA-directed RNA polymerase subunit beta